MSERIRFRLTLQNARLACDVVAEWRELDSNVALLVVELRRHDGFTIELDEAAELCAIDRKSLELQLRIGAIYAHHARSERPSECPVVVIACGEERGRAPVVLEGWAA